MSDTTITFPFTQQQIDDRKTDYVCFECGKNFLTEAQKKSGGDCVTFHQNTCGLCGEDKSVTNIRHYNYLNIPAHQTTTT